MTTTTTTCLTTAPAAVTPAPLPLPSRRRGWGQRRKVWEPPRANPWLVVEGVLMVEGVAVVGAGDTTHNISGRRNPHTTSHQECPLCPLEWVWVWA